jgi:hypothetical protein
MVCKLLTERTRESSADLVVKQRLTGKSCATELLGSGRG